MKKGYKIKYHAIQSLPICKAPLFIYIRWLDITVLTVMLQVVFLILGIRIARAIQDIPQYRTRIDPGCHTEGVYPATIRIQNQEQASGYSVDICSGDETIFYSPRVVLKPGFRAAKGSKFRAGLPVIDVHVVILEECATYPDYTGSPSPPNPNPGVCDPAGAGRHFIHEMDINKEIDLLNREFFTTNGDQIVLFKLKSVTDWSDIEAAGMTNDNLVKDITTKTHCYFTEKEMDCDGDGNFDPDHKGDCDCDGEIDNYASKIKQTFNATPDGILRDHSAINFYIYDCGHPDLGDDTGHASRNSYNPYIVVDYARFDDPDTPDIIDPVYHPVDHEMGHAFGLGHTCSEIVNDNSDPSNLMSSAYYCPQACSGSISKRTQGDRSLGFEFEPFQDCTPCTPEPCNRKDQQYYNTDDEGLGQAEIVLWYAIDIAKNFNLINSNLTIRVP